MASKRVVRAQSLHRCVSKDCKFKQTLRGIWSVRRLRLGDSPPSRSAELRAPLIMQRTAEFKAFSHLWGMFGRGRSHTPESFGAAREGAVWAGRRGEGLAFGTHPEGAKRALSLCPGCSAARLGGPHPSGNAETPLAASWEPGGGHQGAEGTYLPLCSGTQGQRLTQGGMGRDGVSDVAFQAHCSDREFFSVMGSCEQPCSTHLYHYRNNGWHISPAIVWVANTL